MTDRLASIPGSVPSLTERPAGCPFHPRCPRAFAPCGQFRPELGPSGGAQVACWLYQDAPLSEAAQ